MKRFRKLTDSQNHQEMRSNNTDVQPVETTGAELALPAMKPTAPRHLRDQPDKHDGSNRLARKDRPDEVDVTPEVTISDVRPIDGVGSVVENSDWGSAGQQFLRLAEANFEDGIGEPVADLPNARDISNAVSLQEGDQPNSFGLSDMFWAWGQFIDHDIDLTGSTFSEYAPISVSTGDTQFDPDGTGDAVIHFSRTDPVDGTGEETPRQYTNQITSFLDASMVYGSDEDTAASLRVDGGKLLLDDDGLLVTTEDGNVIAGDVRAGENVALTSLQTLFAREHNRLVDEFAEADPSLSDDDLYSAARQRVEAQVQAVTFNEFLPLLVGEDAITEYDGYDPDVNPGISIEFATAAFRFGHSLLSPEIERLEEDGTTIDEGNLSLRDAFFSPNEISENGGIDPILRGLADSAAQELDTQIVEDVRSFLFGEPGAGGLDLAALNIERGRDLGVASYNDLREAVGLERAGDFSDITSDAALADSLESVYGTGNVDLVEAWIGGLAEDPYGEGVVGELFSSVIVDQFLRIRDGDPYWSEGSDLSDQELEELWSTSLSDVIERNSDVGTVQDNALLAYDRIGGTAEADNLAGSDGRDLLLGLQGNDNIDGGQGDDQIEGGQGRDQLSGAGGDDIINGGDGNDFINGGDGDDVLTGGTGNDVFLFVADFGNDTITGFETGHLSDDMIIIANSTFSETADIFTAASQIGQDTVIEFGAESSITLEDVNLALLTQDDFLIV